MTTLIDLTNTTPTVHASLLPTSDGEAVTVGEASDVQPRGRFRTNLTFAQYTAWIRGDVDHDTIEQLSGFCG